MAVATSAWRLARRERIVAAAALLFNRAAYDDVQMGDIARRAGFGKPTLYRYFDSKEALYLEVVERGFADLNRLLEEVSEAGLSPPRALERMIRILVEALGDQVASLRLLTSEQTTLAERWRATYRQSRQSVIESLRAVLTRGIESGDFAPVDLALTPGVLIGMVRGGLVSAPVDEHTALANAIVRLVLGGGFHAGNGEPAATPPKRRTRRPVRAATRRPDRSY
jgi:AcrR family transcriptional regulator